MNEIVWKHFCLPYGEYRHTIGEVCPLCNTKIGFPMIEPELIDILHEKIKLEGDKLVYTEYPLSYNLSTN